MVDINILWGIIFVLLCMGWILEGKRIREETDNWIMLDHNGSINSLIGIMTLALIIALISVWVTNGFLSFLIMFGITIGGIFIGSILGKILNIFLGKNVILQYITSLVAIIYLMIVVF